MSVAQECAALMWADDRASQGLGMELLAVCDGQAEVALTITEAMSNGHGIAHGGFIFALADTAFAFACNTNGERSVASQCTISYLEPARLGERLIARAAERYRKGRQGITDVTITRSDGTVVAEFRGHSRTIPGSLLNAARP